MLYQSPTRELSRYLQKVDKLLYKAHGIYFKFREPTVSVRTVQFYHCRENTAMDNRPQTSVTCFETLNVSLDIYQSRSGLYIEDSYSTSLLYVALWRKPWLIFGVWPSR